MLSVRIVVVAVMLIIVIAGLTSWEERGFVRSERERIRSPQVSLRDLEALVAGNNAFAFRLYQIIPDSERNVLFSPYSISLSVAMLYAGASGVTERQVAEALGFALRQERLHSAFNALSWKIASRENDKVELRIANALWGQAGYEFVPEFLDILALHYGAGVRVRDFAGAPEASREAINQWVSRATNGRISDVLPPGSITADTPLVLTNAIYLNAEWQHRFDRDLTRDGPFYLLGGGEMRVPMMRYDEPRFLNYAEGDGYQAVELPYRGRDVSMILLLPAMGAHEAFEQSLTQERWQTILEELALTDVHLTMPKFRYEASLPLKEALARMGVRDVFDPNRADLSGMSAREGLFVNAAVHKAFIAVDEERTEAAAATALVGAEAAPEPYVRMIVDHPFLFIIRDVPTGTILFLGRVLDPRR